MVLLDHRDSDFDGPLRANALCAVPLGDLAAEIAAGLDRIRPHVVLTLDGSDGHRDHRHVRTATIAAFEAALDGTDGEVDPAALYEHCLPNSIMRQWLDEMRGQGHDTAYHQIDPDTFGRPDAEVTYSIDVTAVRARRDAAIAMHQSQTSPFEHLSRALRGAFLNTDHVALVATRG